MKLRELLSKLKEVQEAIGTSNPMICGGTPRDKYMGHLENISDLDITTGDKTVDYLSQEFAIELKKNYNIVRKTMEDGHSTIFIGNLKIDFSSNFNSPNIEKILINKGIKKPTNMQKEMFSRDFTCNSLLLTLDLKHILDPTHQGFKDLKEKKIKTCLSPEITLTSNRNRVIRAIYLAAKLDFDIDSSIINYVRQNPEAIKISTEKSLTEKLNEAFKYDADKASFLISKMNLWNYIPITEAAYPYYIKIKGINKSGYYQGTEEPTPGKKKYKSDPAIVVQPRFKEFLPHNYDLYETEGVDGPVKHGPGAGWHHMEKYKSIKEFIEAKRKRNKGKYKAEDSWIQDDGSHTKSPTKKKANFRMKLLQELVKKAIDFTVDEYMDPTITVGDDGNPIQSVNPYGGYLDKYLPENDFEGKSPDKLDFGRDYVEEDNGRGHDVSLEDILEKFTKKYLSPAEPSLLGLPDGISPISDEDADFTVNDINPEYGTTDSGNTVYNEMWI